MSGLMVLIAEIGSPHGLRGEVRVRVYGSEPLGSYVGLCDDSGRLFDITKSRILKSDISVVQFDGIHNRDSAESLNKLKLYVPRSSLPAPVADDEFYITDLIGLSVFDTSDSPIGTIVSAPNFGAGDLLEIQPHDTSLPTWYLSFTSRNVPHIDISANRVCIDIPPEV